MGRNLNPRYGQVILVSRYPVLTAVNWSQHWCATCGQYEFSYAPKRATKCEIEHWFPCGADGQAVYDHVITKFSGMGRFTYPWCSAGALCARSSTKNPFLCWLFAKKFTSECTGLKESTFWTFWTFCWMGVELGNAIKRLKTAKSEWVSEWVSVECAILWFRSYRIYSNRCRPQIDAAPECRCGVYLRK